MTTRLKQLLIARLPALKKCECEGLKRVFGDSSEPEVVMSAEGKI